MVFRQHSADPEGHVRRWQGAYHGDSFFCFGNLMRFFFVEDPEKTNKIIAKVKQRVRQ
jgi:hypothetical protein